MRLFKVVEAEVVGGGGGGGSGELEMLRFLGGVGVILGLRAGLGEEELFLEEISSMDRVWCILGSTYSVGRFSPPPPAPSRLALGVSIFMVHLLGLSLEISTTGGGVGGSLGLWRRECLASRVSILPLSVRSSNCSCKYKLVALPPHLQLQSLFCRTSND